MVTVQLARLQFIVTAGNNGFPAVYVLSMAAKWPQPFDAGELSRATNAILLVIVAASGPDAA